MEIETKESRNVLTNDSGANMVEVDVAPHRSTVSGEEMMRQS